VLKGFLESLDHARIFLENGSLSFAKMPTMFAFLRLLGMPVAGAYVVHFVVTVGVVIVVWRVWRHNQNWNLRGAALMTATFLASPYVFDYDLAWLAFPIAWLALDGLRNGWLRGEREMLVVAWLLPLFMIPIAIALKVQVGPFVLCGLLWITARRAAIASMKRAAASNSNEDLFETVL
jgi:hypothetical protein